MSGRLDVLGIGREGEELYRHVLRTPGLALAAHVARLGWTDYEADHALEQLRARRLVRTTDLGELHADHPRAALERVLNAEEARLATRRQDLAHVRDAIDQFAADHRAGQNATDTRQPERENVDASDLVSVHEHLAASTSGLIRAAYLTAPSDSALYPAVRQLIDGGRSQLGLYVPDAVEVGAGAIEGWAAAGEEQRVAAVVPSQFVCFGDDVALATTDWGKPGGDHVVLRDPMVVAAFVELFDRLWAGAVPMRTAGEDQHALIELMQQGLKDEAIARVRGVSLRTVRRRIASLMEEHGVETRFQLALALAERGGLPD